MSEGANERHDRSIEDSSSNSDNGRIYRYLTAIVALTLLVAGLVGILLVVSNEPEGFSWFSLVGEIAIAAFAAGTIGIIYELLMRASFRKVVEEGLSTVFRKRFKELDELDALREAGLRDIHKRLEPSLLRQRFAKAAKAKTTVRILQTWTGFRELLLEDIIRDAAKNGCSKIEFLLLDPTSEQARYRAFALYMKEDAVRRNIANDLEMLLDLRDELQGQCSIEVKVYDAAPTIHVFDFDDTKLMGVYWRGKGEKFYSIHGPQLEIGRESDLGQFIENHVKDLWENKDQQGNEREIERYIEGAGKVKVKVTRDAFEALDEYQRTLI